MDLLTRISRWAMGAARQSRLSQRRPLHDLGRIDPPGQCARRAPRRGCSPMIALPWRWSATRKPRCSSDFSAWPRPGIPYVPIDSSIPPARVASIVRSAGAPVTLTPADIARLSDDPGEDPVRPATSSDPHYIMFTSGSTGDPKGVVITRGCVENFLSWMEAEHHFEPGRETFLNQVVYSFDVSVMDTWTSLLTGGTIVSLTRDQITNPRQLYAALGESDVTVWVSTPTFAQVCLAETGASARPCCRESVASCSVGKRCRRKWLELCSIASPTLRCGTPTDQRRPRSPPARCGLPAIS